MTADCPWRCIGASAPGSSHISEGLPNQDSCVYELFNDKLGQKILMAAVSDGAGSADFAEQGSQTACQHFCSYVQSALDQGLSLEECQAEFFARWIELLQDILDMKAAELGTRRRHFAATFLACLIGPGHTVFFQIGDGAIVFSRLAEARYELAFWPQQGEYANATCFITDSGAAEQFNFLAVPEGVEEVALFSDGLQIVTLQYEDRTVYQPFFEEMFSKMRLQPISEQERVRAALENFLNSPALCGRTDDDKTLILASRRAIT